MWLWPPLLSDLGTQGGFLWVTGGHRVFSWDLAEAPHFQETVWANHGRTEPGRSLRTGHLSEIASGYCVCVCTRVSACERGCEGVHACEERELEFHELLHVDSARAFPFEIINE